MIAAILIITLHTLNNHHNAQHLAISCATDWSARNTLLVAAIRPTRFSLWLPISLCRDQACCDTVTAKQQANGRCVCATSQQPHTCAAYGSHPAHPHVAESSADAPLLQIDALPWESVWERVRETASERVWERVWEGV